MGMMTTTVRSSDLTSKRGTPVAGETSAESMNGKGEVEAEIPVHGRWHIVSMSAWEEEYLNEEVQAFIEFDDNGRWLIPVRLHPGFMDCREDLRDGQPAAEFSWEGGTALTARR